jgi:hypothetical protein
MMTTQSILGCKTKYLLYQPRLSRYGRKGSTGRDLKVEEKTGQAVRILTILTEKVTREEGEGIEEAIS